MLIQKLSSLTINNEETNSHEEDVRVSQFVHGLSDQEENIVPNLQQERNAITFTLGLILRAWKQKTHLQLLAVHVKEFWYNI